MPIDRKQLIKKYVSAMHNGDAALFVGAGLSRPAGFVDWKGLLRECAAELGLDVDRETDLVAVAQYYLNHKNRDRSGLNQILRNEFDRRGTASPNHQIISQLPISTVWTSNFDALLEDHYEQAGKIVDVKSTDEQVGTTKPNRDVIVYKMHGDIARPDEVIISKDDYERYAIKHAVFQNALEGDLLQKNFLFLGFSFVDPHLEYMLGHLRSLLQDSKREHYAIMRRVNRADYKNGTQGKREFEYESVRQSLKIDDLQRYSIQTLLIDDYAEIPQILTDIESHYHYKNIFVSGSADEFSYRFPEARMKELCYELGSRLIENGYNLVSGFGLNIGSAIVLGALERLYSNSKQAAIEKRLWLRPFPQTKAKGKILSKLYRDYREGMISKCGFAVFIAGNKSNYPIAPGVMEEYEIVRNLKKIPVPIGATGSAAESIWRMIEPEYRDTYNRTVPLQLVKKLNNPSLNNSELIDTVFKIIQSF